MWTKVIYQVEGASEQEAIRLIDETIILHSVVAPAKNKFYFPASALGAGKIVWAGLERPNKNNV